MAGTSQATPQDSQGSRVWERTSTQISILLEEGILSFQFLHFSIVLIY